MERNTLETDNKDEIWKSIKGYSTYYLVSSMGRIKSLRSNKIINGYINSNGYKRIGLFNYSSIETKKYIHQIVLQTFAPNTDKSKICNHKDGNKLNNNLSNLEWCTYSENNIHAYNNGLKKSIGERNNLSKLTLKQVHDIQKLKGIMMQKEVADIYNINRKTVYRIWNKKTWKRELL